MASYEMGIKSPELSQEQWKDTGKFANGKTSVGMLCNEVRIVWNQGYVGDGIFFISYDINFYSNM